jgi:hypothetical protein
VWSLRSFTKKKKRTNELNEGNDGSVTISVYFRAAALYFFQIAFTGGWAVSPLRGLIGSRFCIARHKHIHVDGIIEALR